MSELLVIKRLFVTNRNNHVCSELPNMRVDAGGQFKVAQHLELEAIEQQTSEIC